MAKLLWDVIHESDTDDGTATCWCAKLTGKAAERSRFVWISWMADDSYDVELENRLNPGTVTTVATCKSLTSAKRWAARYL